jgi:hypothetical protein
MPNTVRLVPVPVYCMLMKQNIVTNELLHSRSHFISEAVALVIK